MAEGGRNSTRVTQFIRGRAGIGTLGRKLGLQASAVQWVWQELCRPWSRLTSVPANSPPEEQGLNWICEVGSISRRKSSHRQRLSAETVLRADALICQETGRLVQGSPVRMEAPWLLSLSFLLGQGRHSAGPAMALMKGRTQDLGSGARNLLIPCPISCPTCTSIPLPGWKSSLRGCCCCC